MSNLLNISEAASLGFHTMALLARTPPEERLTVHQIADAWGVSANHLAKVMPRLSRAGLTESVRGPTGGFRLARPANQITLLEIYEAVEGPAGGSRCLLKQRACDDNRCLLGELAHRIHDDVYRYFEQTTLAKLAEGFGD